MNKKQIILCLCGLILVASVATAISYKFEKKNAEIKDLQELIEIQEQAYLENESDYEEEIAILEESIAQMTTEATTERATKPHKDEVVIHRTTAAQQHTQAPTKKAEISNRDFLAKLLYCEAGGMNWKGQVYTCSAILNLSDRLGRSVYDIGHDGSLFAVASYVDNAKPTKTQYEVIDYVANGGRIPEICYFRTDHYHNFGTPVCEVDGHYFSKP